MWEFDFLSHSIGTTSKVNMIVIKEGLGEYLFPVNLITKQKNTIRLARPKKCSMVVKYYNSHIMELNDYINLCYSPEAEEVEYNIYHSIANGCTKQGMLNCFIFELKYYTASTELFQRMKTVEILYEGYRETYQT